MYTGVFTALITPFNTDGSIDEEALRAIVEKQIEAGIHGLVPVGSTGESPTVSHEENIEVIKIVVDQAKKRIPVIAGTGSNSTKEAINMTKLAKKIGADASLQVGPYYNKPNQEGFYQHFATIADESQLPMVVYNIPGRSAKNISAATILRLAKHDLVVGVKEASGDFVQYMELIAEAPEDFAILSGDDGIFLPMMSIGAHGLVSVAANILPKQMVSLYNSISADDYSEAKKQHYKLKSLFHLLLSLETNPIPIKYIMARAGLIKEVYRLPLVGLTADQKQKADSVITELNLI